MMIWILKLIKNSDIGLKVTSNIRFYTFTNSIFDNKILFFFLVNFIYSMEWNSRFGNGEIFYSFVTFNLIKIDIVLLHLIILFYKTIESKKSFK